ncbi:MAG TPA: hypothetical protein VE569_08925 [Acidimicrobiia bacterium]|jgi:hypothetical protein|nr:hypothetical protein [Acidimicrobiia bacterium]
MSTSTARFFDNRAAYLLFTTATDEKSVVAERIGDELSYVSPGERALRVFDAGMGDGSVLSQVIRRMHREFAHIPFLVVGKEISIEDVRIALQRFPDRLFEHPEMVVVVTNMNYREAPRLTPAEEKLDDLVWIEAALEGSTSDDFGRQIQGLFDRLAHAWEVITSPKTGNPLYARPSVVVLYRKDRRFILKDVIPKRGSRLDGYDLILASQPYRARTTAERKARLVLVPLARSLAYGGRMVVIHAHGDDPGLEIIRGVWPDEDPFQTGRDELVAEAARQLTEPGDRGLTFPELSDEESIFRYELHAMPSERTEHIGTGLTLAAWNAAAYVAQIDEERLSAAMRSGSYVPATRSVLERYGGVWFNDEAYLILRS